MRLHSGSLLARRRRPAGLPSGQLSQGSYIPFLYGQGLEKWIRLPEARAMGARWAGGGKKLYGLNFYRRLNPGKTSSVSLPAATPLVVRRVPISSVLADLLLGRLSHGSRVPNSF